MKKFIFNFSDRYPRKNFITKDILGGKGANLVEMGKLGLSVPPGFIISTQVCNLFYNNKRSDLKYIAIFSFVEEPECHGCPFPASLRML